MGGVKPSGRGLERRPIVQESAGAMAFSRALHRLWWLGRLSALGFTAMMGLPNAGTAQVLTNVAQVRRLAASEQSAAVDARLDGVVLWTSLARHQVILQDE